MTFINFKNNYIDYELTKIVEINNEIFELSVIDSTFVKIIDDSYYSAMNGLIFVFDIEILSAPNYIDDISAVYNKAKESVKNKLNFIIALKIDKVSQYSFDYSDKFANEKIDTICEKFKCNVLIVSTKTGENVEYLFYLLAKQVIF